MTDLLTDRTLNIDKQQVVAQILEQLQRAYQGAVAAADRAHSTATDDENAPETQYDTLALEAAYLAHGQSQRVAECMVDVAAYQKLQAALPTDCTQVVLGCLVQLVDENDLEKTVFFGPAAGGIKVNLDGQEIVVVTPTSPFGEALLGLNVDDEAEVVLGHSTVCYDIVAIA